MSLNIGLRVLEKPEDAERCEDFYRLEHYNVCIKTGKYYIWDRVSENPFIHEMLREAEEKIQEIIASGEVLVERILDEVPEEIRHIVERQYYGYGLIEAFMADSEIIDVHVINNTPVQVLHRNHGYLETNVILDTETIREIVQRMSSRAGKNVSEAKPLASFIETKYNARVSTTYLSDITLREKITLDIRKQPEKPWTILKLLDLGTLTFESAALLWLSIKYKVPILIIGGLMTGKTTLANAILNLAPPNSRIITIEDTPELKLHSKYWTRTTTRESDVNPVTVFDILKLAMRLSVDYIVVGEVRGEEAREWAQAILLGHGAVTTFHAESPESALVRLRTPPILVDDQALRMISIIVKMIPVLSEKGLVRKAEIYINENLDIQPVFIFSGKEIENKLTDITRLEFIKRIELNYGKPVEEIRKEYNAMVRILREVYRESKEKNSNMEEPDYKKLVEILYSRLRRELGER